MYGEKVSNDESIINSDAYFTIHSKKQRPVNALTVGTNKTK